MANLTKKEKHLNKQSTIYKHFLTCRSCFWCASLLFDVTVIKCPNCNSATLELTPISHDQVHRLQRTRVWDKLTRVWSNSSYYSVLCSYFFLKNAVVTVPLRLYYKHKKLTKKDQYNKMSIEFKKLVAGEI
jgi:hypothetical protein